MIYDIEKKANEVNYLRILGSSFVKENINKGKLIIEK